MQDRVVGSTTTGTAELAESALDVEYGILSAADAVVAVETPAGFRALGQLYRTSGQVPDEEAMTYLDPE